MKNLKINLISRDGNRFGKVFRSRNMGFSFTGKKKGDPWRRHSQKGSPALRAYPNAALILVEMCVRVKGLSGLEVYM
jgi:hypothetical protein